MKLVVEVVSKETINPGSPIPDHLNPYQLSFLDQLAPSVFSPLVLFFPRDCTTEPKNTTPYSDQLKKSLSQTLTIYYPLSGHLRGNNYVDCSRETGVPYVVTQVKCHLAELVENAVPDELHKLLPFELDHEGNDHLLGVQYNLFECGGIVLGICLSHKVGDASSLFSFIKTWGAIARGEGEVPPLEFVSAALFPPVDISGFSPRTGITKENVVAKRLVFDADSIESLRSKLATSPALRDQPAPTRVETLSAFMWTRFVAATKVESSTTKTYFILHAVNFRTRMNPPLPENAFGNFYRVATTFPSTEPYEDHLGDIVSQVRNSIRKVDGEEVKKLQKGKEYLGFMKEQSGRFVRGETVALNFTSLCRFPLYDADFGWGKPLLVGTPSLSFCNLVIFMDTASGDGVEALVHLKEEDMDKMMEDQELLQYVQALK